VRDDLTGWSRRFAVQQAPPAELRADPSEAVGTLSNGLRYIVRENPANPGEVSLRLMILAGSMHEEETEAGFAHFIEHLAFHLPDGGDAIHAFERLGLTAGSDTNAHTAADHTLYRLDLPVADDESLEAALAFLRRVAGDLEFDDAAVDDERRVILREMDEMPAGTDAFRKFAALLPGVRAHRHPPIGTVTSVEAATPAALRGFRDRHYVPSRMVLVIAGDLKMEPMTLRIRRHFDSLPPKPAPAEPDPGDPLAGPETRPQCLAESGKDKITITVAVPQEFAVVPDDLETKRRFLVRHVGSQMLQTRLARTFEGREVPGTPPDSSQANLIPGIRWLELSTHAAPDDAPRVLESLLGDWRQALAHDFHPREFAEARGKARLTLRQYFTSRLGRSSADLATRAAQAARTGGFAETPEDELNRWLNQLAVMTQAECEAMLRAEWRRTPPRILLSGAIRDDTAERSREAMDRAMAAPRVAPRISEEAATWIPDPIGPPGRIVRREFDADRGELEAEFANRVLVRLAPMPSLGGSVEVRVHIGHGLLSAPVERPGIATAAETLVRWHPLENWSHLKLDASLADEDVNRRFRAGDESFQWSASTDRAQLRRQLELLAALLNKPGLATIPFWRPGAHVAAWDAERRRLFQSSYWELLRLQSGRDPRFDPAPVGLMACDSTQVAEWLLPMLATERLAVFVAGDFEPLAALDAIAATFGALPERAGWEEPGHFPAPAVAEPGLQVLDEESPDTTASVTLSFPLGARSDATEELRRRLLRQLLQLRLRTVMRETRGASYAPDARLESRCGIGWLSASVPCPADRLDETAEALHRMILEFREKGWSRDEFRRAIGPLPRQFRQQARNPGQRLAALWSPGSIPPASQLDGPVLTGLDSSVGQLAKEVLDPARVIELRVTGSD
jgi:zinc protease